MISVILPTHDQWSRVRLVLLGFTRMRTREPWELIVVDDGCATPIAELVECEPRLAALPLRIVRLDRNRGRSINTPHCPSAMLRAPAEPGLAIARNRGVAVARGDVCLFLDGDAVPHPEWLENHARLYRRGARIYTLGHIRTIASTETLEDPTVGDEALVVTERDILTGALHDRSVWGSVPMPPEVAARWMAWLVDPIAEPFLWSRFVPHNAGVRRSDFEAVGGFDPAFEFFEGIDLAFRLRELGARACVADDAVSYHLYHPHDFTPGGVESQRRSRGAQRLLAKHDTPEMAIAASVLLAAGPRPEEAELVHPRDALAALDAGTHRDHARLVRLDRSGQPRTTATASRHEQTSHLWVTREEWLASVTRGNGGAIELPASVTDGERVDLRRAQTWGLAFLPEFYEDWLRMDERRMAFIRSARKAPRMERYRLDYEAAIDASTAPVGTALRLDLPFPRDADNQRVLRIVSSDPPLGDHLLAHAGCIYGLRVRAKKRVVVRYSVELEVDEIRRPPMPSRPLPAGKRAAMARFLALPPHDGTQVRNLLLSITRERAPHFVARAIRDWVLAHVHFTLVDRCTCLACCLRDVDTVREGGCAFIASVFVALARAAGIPARLVRGSLLGVPTDTGSFVTRTATVGFGHQWAEAYAEPVGWFPVEFHSCILQPPILTEHNVPSPERRASLLAAGAAAADYLFGSLDNQRVRCGSFELHAAGYPVETTITMRSLPAGRRSLIYFENATSSMYQPGRV